MYSPEGGVYADGVCEQVRRKKFGPRRDEVIGEWRRLPENLHGGQMGGHVADIGERRGAYRVVLGRPE